MDPLPRVPNIDELNDTVSLIRNTFEEELESEVFPADIANNLRTYAVDDNLSLKDPANNVFAINRSLEEESENIKGAESEIIKQHAEYLLSKIQKEKNEFLKELMKIKPRVIFTDFYLPDKFRYGLIQKCDLFPGLTRQYLSFRLSETGFHVCKNCLPKKATVPKIPHRRTRMNGISKVICTETKEKDELETSGALELDPAEIIFKNFELNTVYKVKERYYERFFSVLQHNLREIYIHSVSKFSPQQTIKIKNISLQTQGISILSYPKLPNFTLSFESCGKLAPGMHVTGTVKMKLDVYTDLYDEASFISKKGEILTLQIKCYRDPPKISAYIHKSNDYPSMDSEHIPGSKDFSTRRQRAVNNTIDCGSCLVTEYVLISFVMSNKGYKAQFFWLTEEDFYSQNVNGVSTNLELTKDSFWIYPSYFRMNQGDICDISILFQPLHCGFNAQTLFLMCDNNTYVQIEIVGDGICFNRNMISVGIPDRVKEIEKKEGHRIFLGYIKHKEQTSFIFSILNRSPIFLKYGLKCGLHETGMWNWIRVVNEETYLAPYSTTDLIFELTCPDEIPRGYHNTKVRLFIKDIPIASLEAGEKFLIDTNGNDLKYITENLSVVDVLVMEVELACFVEPLFEATADVFTECPKCERINCSCTFCAETIPVAELEFDTNFLEFGLLPLGADIQKEFSIENLGKRELAWSIVEMKYNVDFQPHIEVVKGNNLSLNYGNLKPDKKLSISYNIVRKGPERYVSILVLFSIRDSDDQTDKRSFVAESICVVTYEIVEPNIVVKTGQSAEPILCPMKMLYTGVPIKLSFKLKNRSLIPGCFYFLKPTGSDADKVEMEYKPQSGELRARAAKKIHLTLKCHEVGILENVFLPCFIGSRREPIQIRLLCVVDCVHVFFYLPIKNNEFQKILWPPKVIYEYDWNWSDYCLCEESQYEYENTINSVQSEHAEQMNKRSEETLNEIKCSRINLDKETEANSDDNGSQDILKTLVNVDSEVFLQECVMEVKRVKIKEPRKITIYFENVTPKAAKYAVQSTNFAAKENNIKACLGPKYRKTEDFWEPMLENHGILVHPEIETGYMRGHELISVDIWIYAKTWGVYVEEIIVDIENITSFSFSIIIEAVGCPLQLPLGIGTITQFPLIRFGSVAFESEDVERNVTIRNTSSIDLAVLWHVFYATEDSSKSNPFNLICDIVQKSEEHIQLNFTDRFYGFEAFEGIEVQPSKLEIEPGKHLPLPIIFRPRLVRATSCDKFQIQSFILGRIFPKEKDRLKSNYFYRKPSSLVIEVNATLEVPYLDVEIEDYSLKIYANDVAIKRQNEYHIRCVIRNPTSLTINAELDCLEPFSFEKIDPKIVLRPGKCKELYLPCIFSYEKILKWASYVYKPIEVKEVPSTRVSSGIIAEVKLSTSGDKIVDEDDKLLVFHKKLFIYYQGGFRSVVPIDIHIYYPHIAVKPIHVKFGYVLLGNTAKAVVYVYNLTGCIVMFEIYKSTTTQEIVVIPPNGEIEKSTGANYSFTKINIYFTPTECRSYHESIRVVTNIPQYFIDIPVKGTGSFNEKFLNA